MKLTTTLLAVCLCFAAVHSLPAPGFQSRVLDRLMARENPQDDSALRNKRTIGLLRQLFPDITKMIEDKVNMVIGEVLKIFGPAVIQTVLGNNNKNQAGKNSADGSTVQAKNPFGDDDDDDNTFSFTDDDDFFNKPASASQSGGSSSGSSSVSSSSGDGGSKITLQLPTVKTEDDRDKTTPVDASSSATKSAATVEDEDVMTVTPVTAESAPPAILRI